MITWTVGEPFPSTTPPHQIITQPQHATQPPDTTLLTKYTTATHTQHTTLLLNSQQISTTADPLTFLSSFLKVVALNRAGVGQWEGTISGYSLHWASLMLFVADNSRVGPCQDRGRLAG